MEKVILTELELNLLPGENEGSDDINKPSDGNDGSSGSDGSSGDGK